MQRWLKLPNILARVAHKVAFIMPGGGTLRPWLHRVSGTMIGKNVWIGQLVFIDDLHPEDLSIGNNCTIGLRTSIFTHFYWGPRQGQNRGRVVIGNDVFVGPHCLILPNVKIGDGAVIRAGTVVSRNVPPHAFWGAPPAEALGVARVPLTAENTHEKFAGGLQIKVPPAGRRKNGGGAA